MLNKSFLSHFWDSIYHENIFVFSNPYLSWKGVFIAVNPFQKKNLIITCIVVMVRCFLYQVILKGDMNHRISKIVICRLQQSLNSQLNQSYQYPVTMRYFKFFTLF